MVIKLLALLTLLSFDSIKAMIREEPKAGSLALNWGLSARQGPMIQRETMEDTHAAIYPFEDENRAFFAVYDGHGGKQVANTLARSFHVLLKQRLANSPHESRETLFKNTFEKVEEVFIKPFYQKEIEETEKHWKAVKQEMIKRGATVVEQKKRFHEILSQRKWDSGSTAVVAFIEYKTAYIAWVGDSRALILRNGKVLTATEDHKLDNPIERKRIKDKGVEITEKIHSDGRKELRVAGLAMPRSVGDIGIKEKAKGTIIAVPDTLEVNLQEDDILILACDGLWDVFSNQRVAELFNQLIKIDNKTLLGKYSEKAPKRLEMAGFIALPTGDPEEAEEGGEEHLKLVARGLRDEAIRAKSTDNVSVLIVQFKKLAGRTPDRRPSPEPKVDAPRPKSPGVPGPVQPQPAPAKPVAQENVYKISIFNNSQKGPLFIGLSDRNRNVLIDKSLMDDDWTEEIPLSSNAWPLTLTATPQTEGKALGQTERTFTKNEIDAIKQKAIDPSYKGPLLIRIDVGNNSMQANVIKP